MDPPKALPHEVGRVDVPSHSQSSHLEQLSGKQASGNRRKEGR